jgi:hypothetical protein
MMTSAEVDDWDVENIASLLERKIGYVVDFAADVLVARDLEAGWFLVEGEGGTPPSTFTDARAAARFFVYERRRRRAGFDFEGVSNEIESGTDRRALTLAAESEGRLMQEQDAADLCRIVALLARQIGYGITLPGELYVLNLENGEFSVGTGEGDDEVVVASPISAAKIFLRRRTDLRLGFDLRKG